MPKLVRDTQLLFLRSLWQSIRQPVWVFVSLMQPIYFLVLFAPLLKGLERSPGFPRGQAMNIFIPGLLIQLGLFGTVFVGFGLIAELRAGLIERLRVTPVSRLALLLGPALRDVVVLLVQSAVLVLLAWPFGLHPHWRGVALTLGLLALLGFTFASLSYALAIKLKSEDSLAPVLNTVTLPAMLLSGILLPLSLAPLWLRRIADVNPLSYAVSAARALFRNDLTAPSVWQALVIVGACTGLAVWLAARAFRQATA